MDTHVRRLTASVSDDGKCMTIRIDGKFDFMLHLDFIDAITGVSGPGTQFVLDMANVTSVDPAGLGMLLMLRGYAGGDVADVRVINCPQDIVRELEALRLNSLINIEPR